MTLGAFDATVPVMGMINPHTMATLFRVRLDALDGRAVGSFKITAHHHNREATTRLRSDEPAGPHNRLVVSTLEHYGIDGGPASTANAEEKAGVEDVIKLLKANNGVPTSGESVVPIEDKGFASALETFVASKYRWKVQFFES